MLICVCGLCIDENEERTERKVTVLKAERKDQERMVNWWRPRWECSQCRCGERRAGRWVAFLRVDNEDEWDTMRHCHLAYCHHSDKATNLVTGVPTGSPSITVSCSLSVKSGISSLTSSSTMKMVASLASCWAPLFWEKTFSQRVQPKWDVMALWHPKKIYYKTYLNTYCEIVFLDPLKIERLIDFHISVRPPVVLPLLEVERVVLVRLVCRASNQLVEYGWVVLYTRAGWGE